jgi:hypothetical protein
MRTIRQRPKARTFLVRARLGHQWNPDELGPRVTDHEKFASGTGVRAYVGFVFDRDLAEPGVSEGGWRPTVEPQEIPATGEYLQHLAHGDLWPANEETAKAANSFARTQQLPEVKFDPTYGGELKELQDWLKDRAAEKTANSKEPSPKASSTTAPPVPASTPATTSTEGKV